VYNNFLSAPVAEDIGTSEVQGFVTDTAGAPINNSGVSMIFTLYEGSTEIWSETLPSVEIEGGVFNVLLGSVIPLDTVRFNRPLPLGIKVGGDPEISPRTLLAAAVSHLVARFKIACSQISEPLGEAD